MLDKAWAERRTESPDAFLSLARSQETSEHGAEFRFQAQPGLWERMTTFIEEEGECCPFFAFEQFEQPGEVVLRIIRPEEASN
ncbi:MAG: hypothetical protein WD939_01920 [Dehalococcoidia bacterium]